MPERWFPPGPPQSSYDLSEKEEAEEEEEEEEDDSFCTMHGSASCGSARRGSASRGSAKKRKEDYSKMPDDVFIKIYFSMLGLLGIYILLKLMMKKK
jgi:hypothetical protein